MYVLVNFSQKNLDLDFKFFKYVQISDTYFFFKKMSKCKIRKFKKEKN